MAGGRVRTRRHGEKVRRLGHPRWTLAPFLCRGNDSRSPGFGRTTSAIRSSGRHPPVQRGPVHTHMRGDLGHRRASQNRPDRVQALLDHRQDNQCQSRPPRVRTPAATSSPAWPSRATVAHQLAGICGTSAVTGQSRFGHCRVTGDPGPFYAS